MKTLLKIITLVFVVGLTNISAQQAVIDDEGIYLMCEKMPELVGGMDAIQKKIRYPLQAKSLGVQGVVYVQCIIDEEGKIVTPKVVKKLGAGCDEEAIRVLKKSKFKPGYDKGKPVKVRFTLPIFFRL
jgi:protein TonB|tara:strand:- start:653 stop:1036 length:384 start_codon:yes stop_codon:yes gene_type:complete